MGWYRQRNGHPVHAADGSALDRVYSRKYLATVAPGVEVEVELAGDEQAQGEPPHLTPVVDQVIADETPPEARRPKPRSKRPKPDQE